MTLDAKEILDWYAQFSLGSWQKWDNSRPNIFRKVRLAEIRTVEPEIKMKIPELYVEFLTHVGEGRLTADMEGGETFDSVNYFMGPGEIREMLQKRSDDWLIYPDFIAPDDLPFFNLGNQSVYVFRVDPARSDAVYTPYGDDKISESFLEFLDSLRHDVEFHMRALREKYPLEK
jgi:hypothetical protein